MIRQIDHIGIAVEALESRLPFWADTLGLEVAHIETVEAEGVKVALLRAGSSRIELLEALGGETPVGRFLTKSGEGIHHLTLQVTDIESAIERLRLRGAALIGEAPRDGAEGSRVAFVHPKSTGGVLVELVERATAPAAAPADIVPGSTVLAYLRDPGEKHWGILRRLDAAGLVIEGIDLNSFDDWMAQIERREESVIGPSVLFLPMSRLDKLLLDRTTGHLPSLAERFLQRTGRELSEVLAEMHGGD